MSDSDGKIAVSQNISPDNSCPVRLRIMIFDFYNSVFRFKSFRVFFGFANEGLFLWKKSPFVFQTTLYFYILFQCYYMKEKDAQVSSGLN